MKKSTLDSLRVFVKCEKIHELTRLLCHIKKKSLWKIWKLLLQLAVCNQNFSFNNSCIAKYILVAMHILPI
jgi:hypothetical protein